MYLRIRVRNVRLPDVAEEMWLDDVEGSSTANRGGGATRGVSWFGKMRAAAELLP
jgi:hypothetical protein